MRVIHLVLSAFLWIGLSQTGLVAQEYEVGVLIGGSNYQGDLADEVIQFGETHACYGLYIRYKETAQLSLSTHISFGRLSGNDANSGLAERRARGFSFSAPFTEVGFGVEWTPFKSPYRRYGAFSATIDPYIFTGVGLTLCDPQPKAPANLQPYPFPEAGAKNFFLHVPIGIGLKYQISAQYKLNLELGYRYVFSGYLDGVSVNGNPKNPDLYLIGGIGFSYVFGEGR